MSEIILDGENLTLIDFERAVKGTPVVICDSVLTQIHQSRAVVEGHRTRESVR